MAEEAAPPAEAPAEGPPAESLPTPQASKTRDPNRPILFRYWSRPTRLQYRYLYDYRHNYYDDLSTIWIGRREDSNRDIPGHKPGQNACSAHTKRHGFSTEHKQNKGY
ncbi:hypothetical protein L9F63_011930 [Diploptera punctata]|uniref:Uncharacterized protein n=1 Tax=Diploptera punctata TaxID=6984 RepID=A0AAD8ENY5_DIPPU|nr:hypothetical protein L9F63_011930 [Diploptera punctata]